MPGKVFISCGQRPPYEQKIAKDIKAMLKTEFGLEGYLAFKIQSLDDIMIITKELRSSDYYLFVDFVRRKNKPHDLPMSLFTHQEFALAHHLGFSNVIALRQKGAPIEGFLKYVLGNPEVFTGKKDLLNKIRSMVKERRWDPDYSRNLVMADDKFSAPVTYRDQRGTYREFVFQVGVYNRRPDTAAIGAVCILDFVKMPDGKLEKSPDRSYLKWAGQLGYERTILPNDNGVIDLFSIDSGEPGIFLHSMCDWHPRGPIITKDGDYELNYKLYSHGFQLVEFAIALTLRWSGATENRWVNDSSARLIDSGHKSR